MRGPFVAALLLWCPAALAAELTPEAVARIRRDQQAEQKKIQQAHGNRPSSELSNEERRQLIEETAAAEHRVLQAHGVDAREFNNYAMRMDPEQQAQAQAAEKKLEAEAKAKEAKAQQKPPEKKAVDVQKGFSEQNPVELEGGEEAKGAVDVQKGFGEENPVELEAPAEKPARVSE